MRILLCLFCLISATYTIPSRANDDKRYFATGTGFFITHDGYALTAHHVVEHCRGDIGLYGRDIALRAKLIDSDKANDLALVKIASPMDIPHVARFYPLEEPLNKNARVVALGYPRDDESDTDFPDFHTADGYIISIDDYPMPGRGTPLIINNITKQGFSGGPILDSSGNLIGVLLAQTCISEGCREDFARIIRDDVNSLEDKEAMAARLQRVVDANMAASLSTVHRFLEKNRIEPLRGERSGAPTAQRMEELAESVVNVRCQALEADLVADKGIGK